MLLFYKYLILNANVGCNLLHRFNHALYRITQFPNRNDDSLVSNKLMKCGFGFGI